MNHYFTRAICPFGWPEVFQNRPNKTKSHTKICGKERSPQNGIICKGCRSLFDSFKKIFFLNHYTRLPEKYQNNIRKLWDVIKEIKGRSKQLKDCFTKIMIIDGEEIFDQRKIANSFNKLFVDNVQKLGLNDSWIENKTLLLSKPTKLRTNF